MRIVIGPADRVVIVGQTGSGKSTLARLLTSADRQLVVVDPKWEEELESAIVTDAATFHRVWPQRSTRVIIRPDPVRQGEDVDEAIARVLRWGRARVLFHEVVDYASSSKVIPSLRRAAKVGRSLGVSLVVCSQRPVGVHNDVLAEADHLVAFRLLLEGDRQKVEGIIGEPLPVLVGHEFVYWSPATRLVRCSPIDPGPPAR
jgi:DNA helicase HerA-like ATPase